MNRFMPKTRFLQSKLIFVLGFMLTGIPLFGYPAEKTTPSELSELINDIRQNQILVWQFDYNYDPYNNGQILRAMPENPRFFILAVNHTYTIFDHTEKREGRWEYDLDKNLLILHCKKINGKAVNEAAESLYYLVKTYSPEKLVLGLQGRHGMTEMVFHPVNTVERGQLSMSVKLR
ncbi:MAG: hypothetical protein SF052_26375 [Bacteroidia bacterium]|nr:hypothetical protein [Bacteroidia bacterium]